MRKYILWFLFLASIFVYALSQASTDFLVKKTTSWDETYTNNLQEIFQNSSLTFEISAIWWASVVYYQINMPTGFTYNNHQVSWNCNTKITVSSNNYLKYNFSWSSNCISVVTFSYTPTITWNYNISILENESSIIKTIWVWVTGNNTIIKAYSLDQNNNWFIDGYQLHFAWAISNLTQFSTLNIGWQNVVSYIGNSNSWVINFADNIFASWDLPQILSSWTSFWNVLTLTNNSIIEEDLAKPILSKINSNSVVLSNTWYISSNSALFDFSEKLHPTSQNKFQIKNWTLDVNGTFVLSWWTLSFTPTTSFAVWNYQFNILSWVKDYSENELTIWTSKTLVLAGNVVWNCTWLPTNASWNSVSSVSRYWDGNSWTPWTLTWTYNETPSTSECRFTCNNWYHFEWWTCVANSRTISCSWLPANASWNTATSISQIWNGTSWTPNDIWVYNIVASSSECRFVCNAGFTYNNSNNTCNDSTNPIWWALWAWVWILINNDAQITETRYVNLTLLATDNVWVTQMMISDNSNFASATWENYNTTKSWTLAWANAENKTVYIKFRDSAWNESSVYSDIITYSPLNSYLNFSTGTTIYTNNTWSTLSWSCRYIDDYWVESSFIMNYSVNNLNTWSLNCVSNTWSESFAISQNTTNNVKIWFQANNSISNSINIINPIPSCTAPTNGYAIWTYPSCDFWCNSWYTKSGNSCVKNSSSSSWWGWSVISTCTSADLECKSYMNYYVWQRKSWTTCSWWNLWQNCSINENNTSTEGTNTNQNNTWSTNQWWWANIDLTIENVKTYLLNTVHKSLFTLVNQLYTMINYDNINYFILSDINVKNNYESLLINYRDLFLNINNYLSNKDKNILLTAKQNYIDFNKYYNSTKALEEKYITKVKKWNDTIYETKYTSLSKALTQIEKIIIWKYKTNLKSEKITLANYKENIKNYNAFILYLSIYKIDKSELAKTYAKEYLNKVISAYQEK